MKNFFRAMIECKDAIFEKKDRPAADAFVKVKEFVESGVYSTVGRARSIAEMRLRGDDPHIISERFGVAYDTIRTELKKMSIDLWNIFPEDFFVKLAEYKENKAYVDKVISALGYYGKKAEDLILWDVVRSTKGISGGDEEYDLSECRDEIDLLLRYSRAFFEVDIAKVNASKLRYLLGVLDGNGSAVKRVDLIKELGGFEND